MKLKEIASMGATASGAIATAPSAPNMKDPIKRSGVIEGDDYTLEDLEEDLNGLLLRR